MVIKFPIDPPRQGEDFADEVADPSPLPASSTRMTFDQLYAIAERQGTVQWGRSGIIEHLRLSKDKKVIRARPIKQPKVHTIRRRKDEVTFNCVEVDSVTKVPIKPTIFDLQAVTIPEGTPMLPGGEKAIAPGVRGVVIKHDLERSEDEDKKRFEAELRRLRMDEDINDLSGAGMRAEIVKLRALIRLHCKASGHDLCWHVPELWQALPEYRLVKPTIEVPPACEFLSKCREYRLSLDRVPVPTKAAKTCSYCNGQGSDLKDGRCPLCRPYCERCDARWDGLVTKDCPQCAPTFPQLEERTQLTAHEETFVEALRFAARLGISYGRMIQLITWEWMHQAPTEALIPSAFEPASTLHPPETFSDRCGKCHACETERIGCPCDGALDDGCFLCTPDRHQRPPCPP